MAFMVASLCSLRQRTYRANAPDPFKYETFTRPETVCKTMPTWFHIIPPIIVFAMPRFNSQQNYALIYPQGNLSKLMTQEDCCLFAKLAFSCVLDTVIHYVWQCNTYCQCILDFVGMPILRWMVFTGDSCTLGCCLCGTCYYLCHRSLLLCPSLIQKSSFCCHTLLE